MEVTKYWISHMRDFYVPVLVLLCLHCAKTTVHLCQLNAGSYVFLKWSENDTIWTYAQPIFECFILPLYALKQTCPMLQSVKHIVTYGKFTMTVQSQPPANISLEVRTCHLSKSWSLVHNFMFLCHNCRSTQTLYAYKTWRNIGLMHREIARGLSKKSWTNLKLGRKTRAIHTHTHTHLSDSYHWEKSNLQLLFGMVVSCLWRKLQVCLFCQVSLEKDFSFGDCKDEDLAKK